MKAALVTGGAGFIGSHLCERLIAEDWSVRVLDDLSTGSAEHLPGSVDLVVGSVTDDELVARLVHGTQVVFHLAAIASVQRSVSDPEGTESVNYGGTQHVVAAARASNAKVVYSSSSAVYGDAGAEPVHEDSPTGPISPYGDQKFRSEALVLKSGGVVLRYFNVFGSRQSPSSDYSGVVSIFGKRAWAGEPLTIFGDGSATRDFVAVQDVIQANLLAVNKEGLYCIGSGKSLSILNLATSICEITGSTSEIRFAPARPGDILHSSCSITKARDILGFSPQENFETALLSTLDWLR
ncbi:MAG TPA: NAD-dependent epimerase/dehydratase family protein [Fimbriimonadaceae bacterium]|nr:NAD-dependent epimerase/dehydratase family protein [Fimbriimonadaceae bacterium]